MIGKTLNLNDEERSVIERAEAALACGLELKRWWQKTAASGTYPNSYRQACVFNRPEDHSFGFYGDAAIGNMTLPVNGNVQHMFYDAPKAAEARRGRAAEWMQAQVREFVLHYFLRVSDYRLPQQVPNPDRKPAGRFLEFLSQCPKSEQQREGFGFNQLFYKDAQSGEVKRFPEDKRCAIVDVRLLGEKYEWIVMKNPIFNFDLRLSPLGNEGPQFVLPLPESNYLVISKDFVIDEDRPEPGLRGRYGVGYAFINDPGPPGLFAYGPGQLEPAFEQLNWEINDDGEVVAKFFFVARQPQRILNVSLDPTRWGETFANLLQLDRPPAFLQQARDAMKRLSLPTPTFDPVLSTVRLMNLLTANQAAERLCISRVQILKDLLYVHFMQHYQTAVGSLQTWRQITNWLDRSTLPDFVLTGRSVYEP